MKILNVKQVQAADAYTIENEPIKSIDLMERASKKFVEVFTQLGSTESRIAVICGTGNNGGDGLAVARLLMSRGYEVLPIVIQPKDGGSKDFLINEERIKEHLQYVRKIEELPDLGGYRVIIDAIIGSGLTRPVSGLFAEVIDAINKCDAARVAIDMPSGLYMDAPAAEGAIVRADLTVSFQLPKLAFFFPENFPYVGEWQVVDIGLDQDFIGHQETAYHAMDWETAISCLPKRTKFDHKGHFGHALLIGGSYGKMGAMVLATEAALRAGAGLVSVNIPLCGQNILQITVPEAMLIDQKGEKEIAEFNIHEKASVVGIGPGLGLKPVTVKAFGEFLRQNETPLVIDADGINILAGQAEFMELLPEMTIITPHLKEFDRLAGDSTDNWQRLEKARNLAHRFNIIIILKGAHTAIIEPDKTITFNTTGNPGMATGGSGDVLFGLITGLLSQGLNPIQAAKLGVYLHGLAGDLAAEQIGEQALIAGDLVAYLGEAFLDLQR